MKPYKEEILSDNIVVREFNSKESNNFEWHRDKEKRKIIILESGEDWFLQVDNQLPELLYPGKIITIEKEVFHRVIAGKHNLKVKIIKDFKYD